MEMSARTSSGLLAVKTGTEGPRHDPYSYTETMFVRGGMEATLHEGLGDWLTVEYGDCSMRTDGHGARIMFQTLTGYKPERVRKLVERANSTCRCGSREVRSERGYPGERLYVCAKCGSIVGTSFSRSAVE